MTQGNVYGNDNIRFKDLIIFDNVLQMELFILNYDLGMNIVSFFN